MYSQIIENEIKLQKLEEEQKELKRKIEELEKEKDSQSTISQKDNKGTDLYYYEFNIDKILDDNHIADYTPQEIEEKVLNIGYINDNSLIRLQDKYNNQLYKMNKFLKTFLILSLTTFLLKIKKEKQNNEKKLQKIFDKY